jgi:REP element-mobilizing transposase RayT
MARKIRFTPDGGALYEVTCRTVHSRFLLRPGPLLNEIIVGALGRAQRLYPLEICAFFFASGHFHLLVRVEDSERLARFMGYFNSKLAREVARSTGWRDKVFSRRYQAILVSDEEEAQVGRLVYILSHGCKENLVARPQDWPGVHCVTALLTGQSIEGTWFNRTKEWEARLRGEEFDARQFAETEVVNLAPLPCWGHLVGEQYRERIAELVETIIAKAAAWQGATGIEPLGPAAILRQQPFSQPAKTKKSPAPLVHAASKRVRTEMKIAYAWFARAFREAAEYLRAGDRLARFPRGSFPPGLPFVRACRLAISPAT